MVKYANFIRRTQYTQ